MVRTWSSLPLLHQYQSLEGSTFLRTSSPKKSTRGFMLRLAGYRYVSISKARQSLLNILIYQEQVTQSDIGVNDSDPWRNTPVIKDCQTLVLGPKYSMHLLSIFLFDFNIISAEMITQSGVDTIGLCRTTQPQRASWYLVGWSALLAPRTKPSNGW